MQTYMVGEDNTMVADIVDSAGDPIESGTVYGYLKALSGDNAGKWWDGAAWSAVKVSAGNMSYDDDCQWELSIASDAWPTSGVRYRFSARESGQLNIPYSEDVVDITTPTEVSFEATVED
jgi:hypothetical protein